MHVHINKRQEMDNDGTQQQGSRQGGCHFQARRALVPLTHTLHHATGLISQSWHSHIHHHLTLFTMDIPKNGESSRPPTQGSAPGALILPEWDGASGSLASSAFVGS